MRIAFLWQGITEHYGKRFEDGLYLALKHLEDNHTIGYFEPEAYDKIKEFNPDVLLYWAALCENQKPMVQEYPWKKAIAFAGGPIDATNVDGFDLYFTESEVNEREFKTFDKPFMRAFGINERIFKPEVAEKKYDGIFWGAFALWKRHDLFAETLLDKGIAIGMHQSFEPQCYEICKFFGTETRDEMPREKLVSLINSSKFALNTANNWGGGQRMTLEAMACNIPPIVMLDSPKNREYVEESGFGFVSEPHADSIREVMKQAEALTGGGNEGRKYIESKWTSQHYADALEIGLLSL